MWTCAACATENDEGADCTACGAAAPTPGWRTPRAPLPPPAGADPVGPGATTRPAAPDATVPVATWAPPPGAPPSAPPPPAPPPPAPPPPGRGPGGAPLAVVVVLAVLLLLVVAGGGLALVLRGDDETATTGSAPSGSDPAGSTGSTNPEPTALTATVARTCGADGTSDCFLSVRSAPGEDSVERGRLDEGATVQVVCQVESDPARSSVLDRSSTVWARTVDGEYVAAVFLDVPGWDPFTVTEPC